MKQAILMSLSWFLLDIGFFLLILFHYKIKFQTALKQFLIGFVIMTAIIYTIFAMTLHRNGLEIKLIFNLALFLLTIPLSSGLSLMMMIAITITVNFFQKFYQKR